MFKQHDLVPSESMGHDVHLWRYGHFGPPVIVFPSAAGMAHEWEAHGMIEALGDWLEEGKLKLYCTESNVAEAWTRKESDPNWKIQRHRAFEQYIAHELAPKIREDCHDPEIPISVTGTSLGAFYSANFALKFPRIFQWALCLSGRYDTTWLTEGFSNEDVYYNNPLAYVSNLDGEPLDEIRNHTHLTLVCGQGKWEDGNIEETQALASSFASKGISHECDLWGHEVSHQWEWWKRQIRYHFEKRLIG